MLTESQRALELDPLSLIIQTDHGANFLVARRYGEATLQLRKALQLDPRFSYAHVMLAQSLQLGGDLDAALAEYSKAVELDPDDMGYRANLGQAYARANRRAEAEQILAHLTEVERTRYVPHSPFAMLLLGLGDKEKATERLERAYRERAGTDVGFIHIDPMLDDLRGYPRFDALVQKILSGKR